MNGFTVILICTCALLGAKVTSASPFEMSDILEWFKGSDENAETNSTTVSSSPASESLPLDSNEALQNGTQNNTRHSGSHKEKRDLIQEYEGYEK